MPLTSKGETILSAMQKQYGTKRGTSVFYASANAGTVKGVEASGKSSSGSGGHRTHSMRHVARKMARRGK